MFKIPEIMTTEIFWGPVLGLVLLFLIATIIVIDRYRRPEVYPKKQQLEEKETKISEEQHNVPYRNNLHFKM